MDYTGYTYDDFLKAAQESGLYGNFSQYDLSLAQQNPAAGMEILAAKQAWSRATTEQERLQANAAAEQVRSRYGSYLGGRDGSEYNPFGSNGGVSGTQTSFGNMGGQGYGGSPYDADIQRLYQQQLAYQPYQNNMQAPTYQNRYDADINQQLYGLINRPDFSYDPSTDPLYSQYRKQYIREGQRATQDALGAAAAASGGIPSSYAVTAASQAGDYYAAQLNDKIPELYQIAYNKYMNDFEMDRQRLAALQGQEQYDYAKYLDQLGQYNTDREFDYNSYMDQYNMLANNLATAQGLGQTDYARYLDGLDQQYRMLQNQYDMAQLAASAGDLSYLQSLGIDTSNWWTLNGPRASGSGGGGGYRRSSGSDSEDGVLATMIAMGDDVAAYDYLASQGYTNTVYNRMAELYEQYKNGTVEEPVTPTAPENGFRPAQLERIEYWTQILLQIPDPQARYQRLLALSNEPGFTQEMMDVLYGAVKNWN